MIGEEYFLMSAVRTVFIKSIALAYKGDTNNLIGSYDLDLLSQPVRFIVSWQKWFLLFYRNLFSFIYYIYLSPNAQYSYMQFRLFVTLLVTIYWSPEGIPTAGLMVTWPMTSHAQSCRGHDLEYLGLNISETVRDTWLVTMDHLEETAHFILLASNHVEWIDCLRFARYSVH